MSHKAKHSQKDADHLLPVKNRTESFWLTERDPYLQNARTTATLPSQADIVIVGSGLTGAMMSYHILQKAEKAGKRVNVVMLEADECCGSATARNGGHCKPVTLIGYRASAKKHGSEIANQLLTFEEAALDQYAEIVQKEDIDCDMHATRAFDIFYRQDDAREAKLDYEARLSDYLRDTKNGDIRIYNDPAVLEKITGVKGGVFGASYPAGHLWPYKLATSLIRKSIQKGMNLQTFTPALHMTSENDQWTIQTSRGSITADSVIIATNAYTSSLLPEFKPLIIPVRGTACSITPAPSHSPGGIPGPIQYTYGFRYGPGEVDYMIPRQGRGRVPGKGDRSIILGGAKGAYLKDLDLWYDNKWDNENLPGAREYFTRYMKDHFVGWNGNEHGNVDHVWSGVLGYSSDLLPLVGEHPDRKGVYVCGGFTGHGMPRIPGCTEALSSLVVSNHVESSSRRQSAQRKFEGQLPKPYWLTKERLESKDNLITSAMGPGDKTKGTKQTSDEVVMLEKAVRAKL